MSFDYYSFEAQVTHGYFINVLKLDSTAQNCSRQVRDQNYGRNRRTFCLRELRECLLVLHSRFLQLYREPNIFCNN